MSLHAAEKISVALAMREPQVMTDEQIEAVHAASEFDDWPRLPRPRDSWLVIGYLVVVWALIGLVALHLLNS